MIYNVVNTLAPSFLIGCSSFFADNKDNCKVLDEFEIWLVPIMDCGVSCSALEDYSKYFYDMLALR